jgi:hypothetical protein
VANGRVIGQTTTPGSGEKIGTFLFDFVPAGDVRVEGQDPLTLRTGSTSGRIDRDGQEVALDVVAQGLGAVQGVVRSRRNGGTLEPEAGAHVIVDSAGYTSATATDASGRYVLEGIPRGTGDGHGEPERLPAGLGRRRARGRSDRARPRRDPPGLGEGHGHGDQGGDDLDAGPHLDGHVPERELPGWRDRRAKTAASSSTACPSGSASLFVDVPGSLDEGRAAIDVTAGEVDVPIVLNGVGSISGLRATSRAIPCPATCASWPRAQCRINSSARSAATAPSSCRKCRRARSSSP